MWLEHVFCDARFMIELHETQQKWPLNRHALHLGPTKVEMTKDFQQNQPYSTYKHLNMGNQCS